MKGFGKQDKFKKKKVINQSRELSKEQLINQAIKLHIEGNIQKDVQKLQNKSREKIAKIDQATSMYNLMGLAFN